MKTRHVVSKLADMPPGSRKLVRVKGRPIVIFNTGGEFFALLNSCPHQGASLAEGYLGTLIESSSPEEIRCSRAGEILRCPWHGWEFDIRTGQSWCDPSTVRVKSYAVAAESGGNLVKGPYVAETFPVMTDEMYVWIEM